VKKHIIIPIFIAIILLFSSFLAGCDAIKNLTDKTPENFTEGIKHDKDYEDDVLEIYDDAIVFDEFTAFKEIVLFCGSEDDFDDIVDFYKDFFEKNEITLVEEDESRDEYFARGVFDGYEFKIQITEPDGDYVEDLFENILTLSTREIQDGEQTGLAADPTPIPSTGTSQNPQATQALTTDAPTERPPNDQSETKAVTLDAGTWFYEAYLIPDNEGMLDWTIYINDESTGTMYYSNYAYSERWWDDFTYTIDDGILSFSFPNGDIMDFFAYYDYGTLHIISTTNFSDEYYFSNYGQAAQMNSFEAFGDWTVYRPSDGFLGTIAFWPNGTGYVYNWFGENSDVFFTWENIDGVINFWDEDESEIGSFTWLQKYNILEYTSQYDNDTYFYNRTELNLLLGSYELLSTSEEAVTSWQLDLREDYTAHVKIVSASGEYEDDQAYWYIDYYDGKLYIYIAEEYYGFNYHYFGGGLLLFEEEDGYYYEFELME